MRTRTLLSITLLGLLLWASCAQADDTDADTDKQTEGQGEASVDVTEGETDVDEEDAEEEPKKEKTTEIEEEKDVMVLHINNFDRALSENQYLLVEFYAPWCGHCKQLEPIYAEAAEKIKTEESGMRLAKVDAIEERELAEEFEIEGFPSLKLFIDGNRKEPVNFAGKRTVEGIIKWMKRRTGPGAPVLDSADSAAEFIDSHKIAVVGFFDNLESEAAKVFKDVAWDDTANEFAVSESPEVFQKYEVKANSVVLFKKFDDGRADFMLSENGTLDRRNLTTFINDNSLELIIPFTEETAEKIFSSSVRLHSLLFINSSVESHTALVEETKSVAKTFKGKMLFITIDVTESISHVLNYFGISESDVPTTRIINMVTLKKYAITEGDFTVDSLAQLCQKVVDGTAEPYYQSQEIPEDWDKGPVKVLVGKNFDSVALDPTKNVFVEFYAPWCGHCKELAPIWDQLGEKYADSEDIIIAKMDATANEVESVVVKSYPTLKYYPADGKEVVDYTGKRDLETMSKFLDNGGVLPKEETDDDDDDEDEDEDEDEDDDEDADDEEKGGKKGDDADDDSKESAEVPTNKTSKDEL